MPIACVVFIHVLCVYLSNVMSLFSSFVLHESCSINTLSVKAVTFVERCLCLAQERKNIKKVLNCTEKEQRVEEKVF